MKSKGGLEMEAIHRRRSMTAREFRSTDAVHYRLIFAAAFVVLFIPTVIGRVFALRAFYSTETTRSKSLLLEVREAAHCCAGIAMQG
jgi:hypothetical protein